MSPSALFGERSPTFCRRRGSAAWVMVWMCVVLGMSLVRPAEAQTGNLPFDNLIQASFAANNAYNHATDNSTLSITPAASTPLTEPVNSTSSGQIATITFTASGTLGAINVLTLGAPNLDFKQTGGGSVNNPPCVVGTTYTAGQACTVFYTFTPSHPGMRYGGITLVSTTGALLASSYISGIGTGPQIIWTPGTQSLLGSGLRYPSGLAVDGSGNLFMADDENNAVKEMPYSAGSYGTPVTLATGFNMPQGIALDGNGNIFVADYKNSLVKEIPAGGGYSTVITIASGFNQPQGVAIDGSGNLFVTDDMNSAVKEIPYSGGVYGTTVTLGSGFNDPYRVALDGSGNVFVLDELVGAVFAVKEIVASSGYVTVNTLPASFSVPDGIAVDGNGNVYVSDIRTHAVYELVAANGYMPVLMTLTPSSNNPTYIALDGSGNIYVSLNTDVSPNIVKFDYADPPTLNFATTAVGQTSSDSPQVMTMSNDGNESLIFTVPSSGPNPTITPGFAVASNSTCPLLTSSSSGGTLPAGAFCNYSVSFTPIAGGLDSGFLIPTDNNLNIVNATQKVPLNGTGLGTTLAPAVISITPHSGPTTGGTTVTITGTNFGTIADARFGNTPPASVTLNSTTQMTAVSPPGTGTVDITVTTPLGGTSATSPADQFTYIDAAQTINFPAPAGTAYAGTAVTLNASASSGLPVTYTVVSGPAYVTGSTLTYTAAGSVVVEADQAGNSSYGPAPPVQITLKPALLTEPVGTASATIPTVVIFSAAGTLANINVLTQGAANLDFAAASGSTCATGTTYAAGQTCTIDFTFTPTRPGLRYGGISLTDSSGDLLASSYVYGEGVGPMVIYSPGTESLVGSGLSGPSGVALDGHGNIFATNNTGTTLTEIMTGTGTVVQIGSFVAGDDVAVDGNGNVFVASNRSTISEVMAVNGTVPASPIINTIYSSFTAINGIKVDANGDVFVACSSSGGTNVGIYEILAVNGSIPANPSVLTLSTAFTGPTGIAIDASGDVYVSDELTGQLDEMLAVNGIIPANPTIVTVASGFNELANVSMDGTGNVFVAEYGNQDVKEILAVNGSIPANPTILTLQPATPGGAIPGFAPEGLFIDGSGNVFVADAVSTGVVKMDFSDPPTLTFADTYIGQTSTDSPQTVTTFNDGNAPLNYTVPGIGFNPAITPGFTVSNSSTCPQLSSSSSPATLAAGASCTDLVSFTPVVPGLDSGFLTTTDNALNVVNATQLVPLNGTGKVNPTPVVTLTGTPNPVFLLNPVTFTATVSSPAFQPTGSVTFLDGTTPLGTVALSGGVATLTTSTLAMGLHSITAVYAGPNFPPQTSPVLLELVEDFSLTITNPDVVIPHGGTAVYNLVVMTVGGTVTASTINFGIAGSPDHSTITFDPATVATGSGTTNITLTIKTPDYPVGPWSNIVRPPVVLALTAFGAFLLPFGRRRRRALLARRLVAVAVLATFAMLSGCGSGWKTQNYSITVTANAGPLAHSASATLTSHP